MTRDGDVTFRRRQCPDVEKHFLQLIHVMLTQIKKFLNDDLY